MKWTGDQDRMLLGLACEADPPLSVLEMSEQTGWTRKAIEGRLRRLGIRRNLKRGPKPADAGPVILWRVELPPVPERGVGIMALAEGDCRYPLETEPAAYCGKPALSGLSYCGPHYRRCHIRPSSERRTAPGSGAGDRL